jgi:hypothetical protein
VRVTVAGDRLSRGTTSFVVVAEGQGHRIGEDLIQVRYPVSAQTDSSPLRPPKGPGHPLTCTTRRRPPDPSVRQDDRPASC